MAGYAVLQGTSYILAHVPDLLLQSGTTPQAEASLHREYLETLPKRLRNYQEALCYPPNQVYIGNIQPEALREWATPWYEHPATEKRWGAFGECMPQAEFYGLLGLYDSFDLVWFTPEFAQTIAAQLAKHPLYSPEKTSPLLQKTMLLAEMKHFIETEGALPLYQQNQLVGLVKSAHQTDENLSAHVMLENLAVKASGALAILHLLAQTQTAPKDIGYVLETSEAACGDANQRGGGNFAKAIAAAAELSQATGADIRGFCAGPAHGMLTAAALIQSGIFSHVIVAGGGCTAKLGMNSKEHIKKGLPVLEDCLAGFALLLSTDDGHNPQIRTDLVGCHSVGAGASPQAIVAELVAKPLAKAGLQLKEIDRYAPELQNPEITQPAGAGDVPAANYKMIAAYGVMQGQLTKTEMKDFVLQHGLPGWAPTQGHIPSGIPYLGFARQAMLQKQLQRVMLLGKGSLFLGRMTNLFDGISLILQTNQQTETKQPITNSEKHRPWRIGILPQDSEQPFTEYSKAAAQASNTHCQATVLAEMQPAQLTAQLAAGQWDAAITMHYEFPLGVSSVGKIMTPGKGRPVYLACTTGVSDTNPVCALIKNAIHGIIAAKADGIANPTVGILNIAGAVQCEKALRQLQHNGYPIQFATSLRADGGSLLRGNDLLAGTADVMVSDPLTGNLLTKLLSAYTTGGNYESQGWGYGPGIGQDYDKVILIVSRASGTPVITNAIQYAVHLLQHQICQIVQQEFAKAEAAGLSQILQNIRQKQSTKITTEMPPKEPVSQTLAGVDVLELEAAVRALWQAGIYAESGMGCTGPVILVSQTNLDKARHLLQVANFLPV